MKKFTSLFVLLTTLALASCSSSTKPQGSDGDNVVDVKSIALNTSSVSLFEGDTYQLVATVSPSDATNKDVHWSSSDDEFVSVDDKGLITALKAGYVTITCVSDFDDKIKATCDVEVKEQGQGDIKVTGVSLNRSSLSLNNNETFTLVATVYPSDAKCKDVLWNSSDSDVATVDENGLVTAGVNGTAVITVTTVDGGFTSTCSVSVNQPVVSVTGVSLNKRTLSLEVGSTAELVATVLPSNATNKNVSWFTSNANVATVTNGLVKAQGSGSATITVKTEDGTKTATCSVSVTEPTVAVTGVSLNNSTLALEIGKTSTLVATVSPENATNKKVTWSSSKSTVASVSSSGLVTAKAKGTATITVKTSDGAKTATCVVTVSEPYVAVTGVSLSKSTLSVGVGKTSTLTATVSPSNASNKALSWASSNSSVATVSSSGVVTSVSEGSANITVTTEDGGKTATCKVTVSESVQDKYTVMIYMCGADLESDRSQGGLATEDIKEICSVKNQPDDVNIIIQTGGASRWESTYGISASKLERWHIANKTLVKDASLSKANMGLSSTFMSFLEWGLDNYPAEKTAVIFWNHGGALEGVCFDENFSDDSLLVSETSNVFRSVLSARGIDKLEWVGYDACLMQVQDIAEMNSEFFNYMIGSQESEAGEGWKYDTWVDDLYAGKETTTILKAICDGFVDAYGSYGNDQTLSYLNLAYMADYKSKFESLASKLSGKRSKIKNLCNSIKSYADGQYGTYDLIDLLNKMKSNNNFSSYKDDIQTCITALGNLIAYNKIGSSAGNSNGLCVVVITNSSYVSYNSSETNFSTWYSLVA